MIKFKIIVFVFFFYKNLFSIELACNFEEVYQNGEIQQGIMLIKDDKLRYQYNSKNLYTILRNQEIFFLIENNDVDNFKKVEKNMKTLIGIQKILNDFPEIEDEYKIDEIMIRPEMKLNNKYIKKISILSPHLNMSVYFPECKKQKIPDRYFFYSPFFQYEE